MGGSRMISVVIPSRDEAHLSQTIQCLVRAGHGLLMEIIVVNDGGAPPFGENVAGLKFDQFPNVDVKLLSFDEPTGVGPCRDLAISSAAYDTIFVCDAHMDFEDGMFQGIVEYFNHEDHADHVACCVCCGLDVDNWDTTVCAPHGIKASWGNTRRYAVKLKPKHIDPMHPVAKHRVFASSWVDNSSDPDYARRRDSIEAGEAVEVPSVLGANYAFRRPWYNVSLGAPWKNMCGWGSSEQTMSLVNWACGGKNVLLPWTTAHWFKPKHAGHAVPPHWILYNQLRLITLLPIEAEPKIELFTWIEAGLVVPSVGDAAMGMLEASPTAVEAAALADGWSPSFQDWLDRWNGGVM